MKKLMIAAAFLAFSLTTYAQEATKTEKAKTATKSAARKAEKEMKKDAKVVGTETKKGAEKVADKSDKAYHATKKKVKDL